MDIVFDTYRSSLLTAIELGIFFGSIGVIVAPSMIYAAFSLGITLLSIAFVYLLFNADLLAAAQVLVYIGAINVLIVFAIMLVGPAPLLPSRPLAYRLLCFGAASGLCLPLVFASTEGLWKKTKLEIPGEDEIVQIGIGLFDRFLLPFETVSLLLLVALIGAIWIARARPEMKREMPSQDKPLL